MICLDLIDTEHFIYETVIPQPVNPNLTNAKNHSGKFQSYKIYGFNQTFVLFLVKDEINLSPSFLIQYFNENQTWINRDLEDCFYTGFVNGNYSSNVSINLCNGLVRLIKQI